VILGAKGEAVEVADDSLAEFWPGFEQAAMTNKSSSQQIVIGVDRVILYPELL